MTCIVIGKYLKVSDLSEHYLSAYTQHRKRFPNYTLTNCGACDIYPECNLAFLVIYLSRQRDGHISIRGLTTAFQELDLFCKSSMAPTEPVEIFWPSDVPILPSFLSTIAYYRDKVGIPMTLELSA